MLVNAVVESLWCIYGNLSDRGFGVPAMFEVFSGHNRPDRRKRRKHNHTNLAAATLEAQS